RLAPDVRRDLPANVVAASRNERSTLVAFKTLTAARRSSPFGSPPPRELTTSPSRNSRKLSRTRATPLSLAEDAMHCLTHQSQDALPHGRALRDRLRPPLDK